MLRGGVVPLASTQVALCAGGTDGAAQLDQAWLNCGTTAPVTRGTAPRRAHPPPQTPRTRPPPQSAAAAPPAWRPPGAWPSLLLRSCASAGLRHGVRHGAAGWAAVRRDGRRRRGAGRWRGCPCVRGARLRGLEVAGASSEPGGGRELGLDAARGSGPLADCRSVWRASITEIGEQQLGSDLATWQREGQPAFQPGMELQQGQEAISRPHCGSATIPLQQAAGRSAPRLQTCPPFVARLLSPAPAPPVTCARSRGHGRAEEDVHRQAQQQRGDGGPAGAQRGAGRPGASREQLDCPYRKPQPATGALQPAGSHAPPPTAADRALPPLPQAAGSASTSQRAAAEVQQQFKELTLSPAQREGKEPVFEGRVTGGCCAPGGCGAGGCVVLLREVGAVANWLAAAEWERCGGRRQWLGRLLWSLGARTHALLVRCRRGTQPRAQPHEPGCRTATESSSTLSVSRPAPLPCTAAACPSSLCATPSKPLQRATPTMWAT